MAPPTGTTPKKTNRIAGVFIPGTGHHGIPRKVVERRGGHGRNRTADASLSSRCHLKFKRLKSFSAVSEIPLCWDGFGTRLWPIGIGSLLPSVVDVQLGK